MNRTIMAVLAACICILSFAEATAQKKRRKPPRFQHLITTVQGDVFEGDVRNIFPQYYEIDIADSVQRKRMVRIPREYVVTIENVNKMHASPGAVSGKQRQVEFEYVLVTTDGDSFSCNLVESSDDYHIVDIADQGKGLRTIKVPRSYVRELRPVREPEPASGAPSSFPHRIVMENGTAIDCLVVDEMPNHYIIRVPADNPNGYDEIMTPKSSVTSLDK